MSLRCIVADDEPLAKMLIETYVRRTPGLELAGAYTSATEARKAIESGVGQLAFLDIQMPGMTGLQLAHAAEAAGVRVVFITAFREYAVEGFRVNAVDYLLKPVSYEEFLVSANRALDIARLESSTSEGATSESSTDTVTDSMTVRSNYRSVRIEFADILYVEGLRDYVKIHLCNSDRPVLTQMSLKAVNAMLPATGFARIHRSYIIAIGRLKDFSRSDVTLDNPVAENNITLPIGDTYRAGFVGQMAHTHLRP